MGMQIEEAIKTAIEYEIRVREVFVEAAAEAVDTKAKRVLDLLAEEENDHVEYLKLKLSTWLDDGVLSAADLSSAAPEAQRISENADELQSEFQMEKSAGEIEVLKRAFEVEKKTSDFYKKLIDEVDGSGKVFFRRFLEIENGHCDLLQAEIGAVYKDGYWFDNQEFDLEKA